ncbi:MAG: hypothetical protein Q6353_000890, partial [Candidatus Sigynarchaeum springense]
SRLLLYFFLSWVAFGAFLITSDGIATLIQNVLLYQISYAFIAPLTVIFWFAFVDEAMHEGLGIKKTVVAFVACTVMSTFVLLVPGQFVVADGILEHDSLVVYSIPNENLAFCWLQIVNIVFSLNGLAYLYWGVNTFRKSPPALKKRARSLLLLSILMVVSLGIQFVAIGELEFLLIIQSILIVLIVIGTLIVIKNEPRIAHLLPYTVYKLIITSKNGPKYYTKSWAESGIDDDMLAGLMSAIGTVVKNTMQKIKTGAISEIKMYKGVMLTEMRYLPVNIVLVASKASGALKQSLEGFSEEFVKIFYNCLYDKDGFAMEVLDASSTFTETKMGPLITKYFKNVPSFDAGASGSVLSSVAASSVGDKSNPSP